MAEVYYIVEKILDRRELNGKLEYKIKWKGYPLSQCTWEPVENLENVHQLMEEYDRLHPFKNGEEKSKKIKKSENDKEKKKIEEKKEENIVINENEKEKNKKGEENNGEINNDKVLIYENENTYKVDETLKNVVTIKNNDGQFNAIVNKIGKNGQIIQITIPTSELRKINPWILIEFYESKIKFT